MPAVAKAKPRLRVRLCDPHRKYTITEIVKLTGIAKCVCPAKQQQNKHILSQCTYNEIWNVRRFSWIDVSNAIVVVFIFSCSSCQK